MSTTIDRGEFESKLNILVGKPVWEISAVACTVLIKLGEKIFEEKAHENSGLPGESRDWAGELEVMLWCAWRIESEGSVAYGSGDRDEHMVSGLDKLVGKTVTRVSTDSYLDLLLVFSDDSQLRLFSNRGGGDGDSYTLFMTRTGEAWSVERGVVVEEERE